MGHSWSSRRRHNHRHHDHNRQPPNQNPSLPQSPHPPSSNPSVTVSPQPSSPPALPSFAFAANAPYPSPPPPIRSPVYVDHPKKINNYVNVHKDSIRIEVDEKNKDFYLISFTFDAIVDGSITIFYFAKEGANCTFSPLYPEIHPPVRINFQKGLGQKFHQPSGTGIDLGCLDMDDISKPFQGDVFSLVLCAESCTPSMDEQLDEPPSMTSPNAQITQAVLEKNNDAHFQVKVVNKILWANGVRYELREIYGSSNSNESTTKDPELGKECVICMTDSKDTAVLPCRHMCMCISCAKELRLRSDKCPICRQPIEELLEIEVK